ncbi:MAG: methionyl-tRNA formyltransferase [Puniceicoccales bacterium]|nr:methionyl-tRNA formyltransferase [Puniceicoccales bacterium]
MGKRVVFLGSDGIGAATLKFLTEKSGTDWELVGVVSGPDRPSGRGLCLHANPIVEMAKCLQLPLFQPEFPKTELLPWLAERRPELGIVFAYGHILRQDVLDALPLGWINLHASLLPELRGPSPVAGAILQRKLETGISLMQLVRRMDAGPVYGTARVAVDPRETTPSLREKLSAAAVVLMKNFLADIFAGQVVAQEQDENAATYTEMIRKEDGLLDFRKSAAELEAQVRAYAEWPGSFFINRGECIRVGSAALGVSGTTEAPGTIIGLRNGALEIATGNGILCCLELQRPTKKMLPADAVWRFFTHSP